MTRILVIRFSSIGDIILTTPVLRHLKEQLDGEVELHFLTKEVFRPLLELNPNVDQLWSMGKELDPVLNELEKIEFDYVVDLHRNLRTALVKRKVKGLYMTFDKLNFKKWLLVNFHVDRLPRIHIVGRYMAAIKPFGVVDDGKGLDYFLPESCSVDLKPWSFEEGDYVAWVIGAAHPGKRFSASKVSSILNRYMGKFILIGGPEDKVLAEEIMSQVQGKVLNMVGRCSLHESAWLLKQAQIVITPDTGMMHIASALKKRIFSLWGCTVPEFGMYPYRPGEGSMIFEPVGMDKRPCSKLGDRCKYPVNCIEQIDEEALLKALE
jgi:heptosyltransferase-2